MIYISEKHGCVYSIYRDEDSDGDYLICHPLNDDNTFNPDTFILSVTRSGLLQDLNLGSREN